MTFSVKWLGPLEPLFDFRQETRKETERVLRAARLGWAADDYLARATGAALVAAVLASVASAAVLLFVRGAAVGWALLLALGVGVVAFAAVRLAFLLYPRGIAANRAKLIDEEFPAVALMCYALSQGGMTPLRIFTVIAEERDTYGEISREFAEVLRDVEWLGDDLTEALRQAGRTTPSATLRGFFDGLVTIINAGAEPVDFFRRQTEHQMTQAEMNIERELDHAGLLAEVYVSGLLVLPLLLIVLLSLLSALGNGGEDVVPMVVYVLIPGGTLGYLLLLEILLPPSRLQVPHARVPRLADFGIETVPSDAPVIPPSKLTLRDVEREKDLDERQVRENPRLRRRLLMEWGRRRSMETWKEFSRRALEKPVDAIEVSGAAALLLFAAGGAAVLFLGARGTELVVAGTTLLIVAALVALVPVAVFHEIRVRRAHGVEAALPDFLGRLSGFNERGIGLLRAFEILGRTATGPLAPQLRAVEHDVQWNSSLSSALARLRSRVKTLAMAKLTLLFQHAAAATGDLRDVLRIVAVDTARTQNLRERRRQAMMTYVIVVYVVFAVFLYVVYIVTNLFYGAQGFAAVGGAKGIAPEEARLLFFHAVVIQGACCGVVAGKLGEGHLLSGIKHAAVLALVAWAVFGTGVLD